MFVLIMILMGKFLWYFCKIILLFMQIWQVLEINNVLSIFFKFQNRKEPFKNEAI